MGLAVAGTAVALFALSMFTLPMALGVGAIGLSIFCVGAYQLLSANPSVAPIASPEASPEDSQVRLSASLRETEALQPYIREEVGPAELDAMRKALEATHVAPELVAKILENMCAGPVLYVDNDAAKNYALSFITYNFDE
jgi:hypothetical protein